MTSPPNPELYPNSLQRLFSKLPYFLREEMKRSPAHGNGVHRWLFVSALKLHQHLATEEIFCVLQWATKNCGRDVPAREITSAIRNSADLAGKGDSSAKNFDSLAIKKFSPNSSWPSVDPSLIERVTRPGMRLSHLSQMSCEIHKFDPESVVDILFPGNPLLCCGTAPFSFATLPRESWRGKLREQQFIVPNPMSAAVGLRMDGSGMSAHTLANTGPRRFIVVEFDQGSMDVQASIVEHLAEHAPLAMIVFSGGKSLHAWFYCEGETEDKIRGFFQYAVRLGADPKTWTRSQFVRMPWGTRIQSDGSQISQVVVFLNPQSLSKK